MADAIGMVLLSLGIAVALTSALAVLSALFPSVVGKTRQTADRVPGRSFVVGLVNMIFLTIVVAGLFGLSEGIGFPLFIVPAVVLSSAGAGALLLGLAGAVKLIGERLLPERSHHQQMVWGGLATVLGCLTPFIGWFGLFPYVALLGFGAFILSWFRPAGRTEGLSKEA